MPLASLLACIGIQQEVGTPNDEICRFLFDAKSGRLIDRKSFHASLVRAGTFVGVRIWSTETNEIEIRFPGLYNLLHPTFSGAKDGNLRQLVVFPEMVVSFLEGEGVEPVVVVPWAKATVFGSFTEDSGYYQTNMWELANRDAISYAALVEKRQLAFLGTHDLFAHIAGTTRAGWDSLVPLGTLLKTKLDRYFTEDETANISSMILPYIAGIMLDDLAQPPCYGAFSRRKVLQDVLTAMDESMIAPYEKRLQVTFPDRFKELVTLARFGTDDEVRSRSGGLVRELVNEIRRTSVRLPHYEGVVGKYDKISK